MRHGHSPAPDEAGVGTDFERPLSENGRKQTRQAAAALQARGARPAAIFASPLVRAQQTAAEAASQWKPAPSIVTYEPLSNQISGTALIRLFLREHGNIAEALLVGHQPQIGAAAEALAGGGAFPFRTASIAAFEVPARGSAALLWFDDVPAV